MHKHAFNITCICLLAFLGASSQTTAIKNQPKQKFGAYLFAYFTGNDKGEEAIRFATSVDGYNFRALNGNNPVVDAAKVSSTGGLRDPHILRGADGKTFYMVATDMHVAKNGWGPDSAMVLMKSNDLVNWRSAVISIPQAFPQFAGVNRVWAPETIYDEKAGKYLIYWSMRAGNDADVIYYAYANSDFTGLETTPKQLFNDPTKSSCIDADITYKAGKYYLVYKRTTDAGAGLAIAISNSLTEGYVLQDGFVQQTTDPVEGAGVFKLNDGSGYILMYDVYSSGRYAFTKTADFKHFTVVDSKTSMNFHPRHGTVMPITITEAETLTSKWMTAGDVLSSAGAPAIHKINIVVDSPANNLLLPVKAGTGLSRFNPQFMTLPGVNISPSAPQNFTHGPVNYTVTIKGQTPQTYAVAAKEYHNPVLDGYYADPDIIYSRNTSKFYMYPTSDGFTNWSGTYFKAFSSDDLVHWKDEGVIIDLKKDVSWAHKNAWAPTMAEVKTDSGYQYFFYFCAAQKIGVAVAKSPTGPFVDSGRPLFDKRPDGANGGQQIDPAVFTDPQTGKHYLYWGNGYMAVAELNDDMVSLKPNTTKVITPDATFREGSYVIYRKGTYYFLWSENDTRDADYQVRYGTASSPLGPITIPANNLVIAKDASAGIYGTGHNSIIQVPGKDEWYIVYHRFTYPKGIAMGYSAGYNREVCIDKLEFSQDGSIQTVKPTHEGIKAVNVKIVALK